jgi:hypothetical protein
MMFSVKYKYTSGLWGYLVVEAKTAAEAEQTAVEGLKVLCPHKVEVVKAWPYGMKEGA